VLESWRYHALHLTLVCDLGTGAWHWQPDEPNQRGGFFAGFFFGVRRSISAWAFDDENLFDPGNRIIGQEGDLFSR